MKDGEKKHHMLIINGKLSNLNDYITACRTPWLRHMSYKTMDGMRL